MWGVLWPVLAFAAGALITAYRGQYAEYATALTDIIKDIEFVRDRATQYWVADADPAKDPLVEVEIRSGLHQISSQVYRHVRSDIPDRPLIDDSLLEFHVLCTGGAFETAGRTADRATASQLRMAASSLVVDLRRERMRVSTWAHVFVAMAQDLAKSAPIIIAAVKRVPRWKDTAD